MTSINASERLERLAYLETNTVFDFRDLQSGIKQL